VLQGVTQYYYSTVSQPDGRSAGSAEQGHGGSRHSLL